MAQAQVPGARVCQGASMASLAAAGSRAAHWRFQGPSRSLPEEPTRPQAGRRRRMWANPAVPPTSMVDGRRARPAAATLLIPALATGLLAAQDLSVGHRLTTNAARPPARRPRLVGGQRDCVSHLINPPFPCSVASMS